MQRRQFLYTATALFAGVVGVRACSGVMQTGHPSADVVAGIAEQRPSVPVGDIAPGSWKLLKLLNRPVILWHRDDAQMARAQAQEGALGELRDHAAHMTGAAEGLEPTEANLTLQSRWFAAWSLCTRQPCLLVAEEGDFDGFFCPCCASHYDLAGRIRKGPAPRNLQVIHILQSGKEGSLRLDLRRPPALKS